MTKKLAYRQDALFFETQTSRSIGAIMIITSPRDRQKRRGRYSTKLNRFFKSFIRNFYSRGKKNGVDNTGNYVEYKLSFGCMHLRCCRAYEYTIDAGDVQR